MRGFGSTLQRELIAHLSLDARAQILALASVAALVPAIAVALYVLGAAGAVAALGVLLGAPVLLLLHWSTRPLDLIAARLAQFAGGQRAPSTFEHVRADLEVVIGKIEDVNRRAERDPVTHLPVREEFLLGVNADLESVSGEAMLGLLRFANYERLAAFDAVAARRVLAAFAGRLRDAVNPNRRIGHVDRDCFAIWFAGVDRKRAAAELKALSYVLTQDMRDAMLTITPDVQVGFAIHPLDADDGASLINRAFVSLVWDPLESTCRHASLSIL